MGAGEGLGGLVECHGEHAAAVGLGEGVVDALAGFAADAEGNGLWQRFAFGRGGLLYFALFVVDESFECVEEDICDVGACEVFVDAHEPAELEEVYEKAEEYCVGCIALHG